MSDYYESREFIHIELTKIELETHVFWVRNINIIFKARDLNVAVLFSSFVLSSEPKRMQTML